MYNISSVSFDENNLSINKNEKIDIRYFYGSHMNPRNIGYRSDGDSDDKVFVYAKA